ncbi:MAG: efflux transporter outer membrane subunit, partial [Acidobacteria bacterium]|nr:efflux transporter outer membrane subunit [Acidobacteriota bacterium]
PAQPRDAASRGKWWQIFDDAQLDDLEEQIAVSNQSVVFAEAQFRASREAAQGARASLFPTVTAGASAERFRGLQLRTDAREPASFRQTIYSVPVDFNYQLDVWGRIRRGVEAQTALAQASAADVETVRLNLQAELAADYFELRSIDAQIKLLDDATQGYADALKLTTNRQGQGVASELDVAQAQTQLDTTRAQAIDLAVSRALLEHAIATLVGKPAAALSIAPSALPIGPPAVPIGVASELLERRPDVAGAERRMAAANAQVGVAMGAFFPMVTLAASGGYESSTLEHLFFWPSRVWSVGAAAVETLLDFGKRRAATRQARAEYDAAVAAYRQSVLVAFQEVEDNLAASRILAEETTQQAAAVSSAGRVLEVAQGRYLRGVSNYLEVISAQSTALTNQRTAIELVARRMTAAVNLVKALGGGWATSDLPTPGQVLGRGAAGRAPS